jgi:transposase
MSNKKYDTDFINETLNLIEQSDKSVSAIAKDLGIATSTIHGWIRKKRTYKDKAFPGKGNPRDKELYELKKELADVKLERDILKKAISIFSKQSK